VRPNPYPFCLVTRPVAYCHSLLSFSHRLLMGKQFFGGGERKKDSYDFFLSLLCWTKTPSGWRLWAMKQPVPKNKKKDDCLVNTLDSIYCGDVHTRTSCILSLPRATALLLDFVSPGTSIRGRKEFNKTIRPAGGHVTS